MIILSNSRGVFYWSKVCPFKGQSSVFECLSNQLKQVRSCHQSVPLVVDSKGSNHENPCGSQSIFNQELIVVGKDIPEPWKNVSEVSWPECIQDYLTRKGISKPTAIQAQTWPIALAGRDLVGVAQTGSGKTLAYILPALVRIDEILTKGKRYIGPKALVLAPTRELAQQIDKVCVEIGKHSPVCFSGGASRRIQIQSLLRQPELIVATPGRLNDIIEERAIDLSSVNYLVLDEADRMLDLGFEAQIRRIIERTPKPPRHRQTLLFSATWPKEVKNLSLDLLREYIQINVGSDRLTCNPNIKQHFIYLDPVEKTKESKLFDLLTSLDDGTKQLPNHKVLIFVATKLGADQLQRTLNAKGFFSLAIHSDRAQYSRDQIIEAFKSRRRAILIATDVASRGLDIDDITAVVNFDMPNTVEDYVHRIGRTARSHKSGSSYSFFTPEDSRLAEGLMDLLKSVKQSPDKQLLDHARLITAEQKRKDKFGYPRYAVPVKRSVSTNLKTNFRRVQYR